MLLRDGWQARPCPHAGCVAVHRGPAKTVLRRHHPGRRCLRACSAVGLRHRPCCGGRGAFCQRNKLPEALRPFCAWQNRCRGQSPGPECRCASKTHSTCSNAFACTVRKTRWFSLKALLLTAVVLAICLRRSIFSMAWFWSVSPSESETPG